MFYSLFAAPTDVLSVTFIAAWFLMLRKQDKEFTIAYVLVASQAVDMSAWFFISFLAVVGMLFRTVLSASE